MDGGASVGGSIRIEIPVVRLRCPVAAQSIVDLFRSADPMAVLRDFVGR